MAIKKKNCSFCGKKCKVEDMIPHDDKFLCDSYCLQLYEEAYEGKEVKKDHE